MGNTVLVIELVLMWVFFLASSGLVILSIRALKIEKREGLRSSTSRVIWMGILCSIVTGLVVFVTFGSSEQSFEIPSLVSPSAPSLDSCEDQLQHIQDQSCRDSLAAAMGTEIAEGRAASSGTQITLRNFAVISVPFLVIIQLMLVMFLGETPLLLLFRSRGKKLSEEGSDVDETESLLDAVTDCIIDEKFSEALKNAELVDEEKLEDFDWMDWVYLKSFCQVWLATTQHDQERVSEKRRSELLSSAISNLKKLLKVAPNRSEATYLLATAYSFSSYYENGYSYFKEAEKTLKGTTLPFAKNKSVCLLKMAESKMVKGDTDGASQHFDQVTQLGILTDQIPDTMLRIRLLEVRKILALAEPDKLDEARKGIHSIRQIKNLEEIDKVELICDVYEIIISLREEDDQSALKRIDEFLERHVSSTLPEVDEEIVDEHLESPLDFEGLAINEVDKSICFAFYVQKAVYLSRILSKKEQVTPTEIDGLVDILFRALLFELRHPEVLAALGCLYFCFKKDQRSKGMDWLEAGISLGSSSSIARRIFDSNKHMELDRKDALDHFRKSSSRFLHDPTLSKKVRQDLRQELGRFQEYQSLISDLDESKVESIEPSLSQIRNRAKYVENLIKNFESRSFQAGTDQKELAEMHRRHLVLLQSLETSSAEIQKLEKKLMVEIGKLVLT